MIVLAGYMKVLETDIVNAYTNKIINLHPALPGSYVGKNCIMKAWENRLSCNSTGVMVHWVTEELDKGDYITAVRIPIYSKDSYEDLESRIRKYEKKVLVDTVQMIADIDYLGNNIKPAEKYPHIYTGKVREIYDIGRIY